MTEQELFTSADVPSVHLVPSARTRGLVSSSEFAAMKPSAIPVNTSRGQDALLDTLRRKAIRCAALDVYDVEPLPPDHPLRTLPNTVLTPHIGYVTRELYEVFYRDAVEDIAAFQRGQPVRVTD